MCSISLGLQIAGTLMSVAGQIQQGRAAKNAANFQAAVARNNAILAERAAKEAEARGEVAVDKSQLATRQFIARQKVAQAGQGQEINTGSALDLTADSAAGGKLDELTIRANAEREAIGFRTQGMNFAAEAGFQELRAQNASAAGRFGALTTLVTGAGRISARFPRRRRTSVPIR